jgi:S-DNA-T family DNA segregation ATPase FtsK/SpoIIIE
MNATTTDAEGRWVPAPGSVARHTWPLPARWAWWLLHRPALAVLLAAAVVVGVLAGPVLLGVGLVVLVAGLVVWWRARPVGFEATAGRVLLGVWRSAWAYGARWRTAMMLSGLGGRFEGDEYLPRVVRVRAGRWADRVVVRIVAGQQPADWSRRADALAHAFGARTCQVRETGRPGYVELRVGRRDPLAAVVPALPVPDAVDLGALPLGRREDGSPWTVRLAGAHVLIAGATGAGKGSVLWSLIRAVAPWVRDGLVHLWVLDPKGGMELSAGAPLFARFAYDSADDLATLLEEAVAVMNARAARLRGVTRKHTPSTDEPLIVVVVDELASLTAYADRDERRRINSALPLLISKGRAVGVVVVGALQDPRKETIPFRDLFPTRIALALVEAEQTDLVLGRGARQRGADCSRIPLTQPGTAWVWCDGETEPTRVRASWVSDVDIAALAETYAPGRGGGNGGQVVDLPPVEDGDGEAGAA